MYTIHSDLPPEAKCTRCKTRATIRMPHHHANFCRECFILYFRKGVERGLKKFGKAAQRPLLVAVSGGKDSLAVWDVLNDLGYQTKGLHVSLGIDEFSEASIEAIERFAKPRGLEWVQRDIKDVLGYTIPEIRRKTRRKICAICGLLKRQLLNRLTIREGFEALVTGHNLDDEAGRLMGNILRHRDQYLENQYPYLPSPHPRMPAKLKPLYRLEAGDIRTYCRVKEIVPLDAKCPLSRGATSHIFKEALEFLESKMPGTKRDFLFTYIDRRKPPEKKASDFGTCIQCNEPTYSDLCSVCNLMNQIRKEGEKE